MNNETQAVPPPSSNNPPSPVTINNSKTPQLPTENKQITSPPKKSRLKTVLASILILFIGIGIGSCGNQDPKESSAYKSLNTEFSQVSDELHQVQGELKKTQQELNTAKEQAKQSRDAADKWSKQQDEKKATEDITAREKTDQENAAQDTALQQQAQPQAPQPKVQPQQPQAPQPKVQPQQPPLQTEPQAGGTVHRGAFCSSQGSTGIADRGGNILTCRVARDGRLRWMS
jgi:chemotaxis protein histidine kinase CheA